MGETILICDFCEETVCQCSECKKYFSKKDYIICWNGEHFCNEECLKNYLLNLENYETTSIREEEIKDE